MARAERPGQTVVLASLWLAGVLLSAQGAWAQSNKGGDLYRWVDDKGQVHYSDHVPADEAKNERETLNARGDVTKVIPRQKSAAELQADAQDEARQKEQQRHDRSLLLTYSSVADIELARKQSLAELDRQIANAAKSETDARSTLADLYQRRETLKDDDAPPPASSTGDAETPQEALERQIRSFEQALDDDRKALDALQARRRDTSVQFQTDIDRFKTLTGQLEVKGASAP